MASEPELPAGRAIDYTLDDVYLHGRGGGGALNIGGSVTGAELELTIEGASTLTLTVEDPELALLQSKLLTRWTWGTDDRDETTWVRKGRAVDVRLVDDVWFRLVKVSKAGTTLTLTFEDRIVTYLRRHFGPLKASRADDTRAEFILAMVRRVQALPVPFLFYCPKLHTRQPIAKQTQKLATDTKKAKAKKGLDGDGYTIKGQPATDSQKALMERALDVADSLNAPARATLALLVAIVQESTAQNLSGGDRDSRGPLQVRDSTAGPMGISNRDPEACFHAFLTRGFWGKGGAISLARKNPGQPADWVAQQTQGSAYPDAYRPWLDECRKYLSNYQGGGGTPDGETYTAPYEYAQAEDEDAWTAAKRLADEVAWRFFVRQGNLWYISDEDLFRQRAAMTLRERENGVDVMDWDLDIDAADLVASIRVEVRMENGWKAWPGEVAIVEGQGPADGRYLVSTVRRDLLDVTNRVEVTLSKPVPAKLEPAPEEKTRAADDAEGGSDGAKHDAVYKAAMHIDSQNRSYVYGGGHGKPLDQIGPSEGLDCSSSTSLALKRGGLFDGDMALVSGAFARAYGEPGKGKYMTVWASDEHVFIEFTDRMHKRFDTSPYGTGPSGPHVREWGSRSTAGFTPRHWPGT
jgi:hypothetical protein